MDFISFLDHDANVRANALYTYKELQEAFDRSGLVNSRPTFREFVDAINLEGSILKRGAYGLPRLGANRAARRATGAKKVATSASSSALMEVGAADEIRQSVVDDRLSYYRDRI